MKKYTFIFLALFSIGFSTFHATEAPPQEKELQYEIIEDQAKIPLLSPSLSEMQTAKIRLENGLEAYLISDPGSTKSGAALTVNTGSWDDPKEYPGLAHFLEHMIFMGNEKYPDESEYSHFIAEHGGAANAFTTNDATSYLFTVDNQAFEGALDRFASTLKSPLFQPSGVTRELNAIDQEYAKNLDNDSVRMLFVLKALTNPEHPNYRFNIGNTQTLEKVSQETLRNWYREHYSANLMKLVVQSTLPLNELKQLVVENFKDIPNYNYQKPDVSVPANNKNVLGHYVYIEPVQDERSLILVWNLPPKFADQFEAKPEDLICYVLGDEGENSLLAQLKREKLAEAVSCGSYKLGPNLMTMFLEVELTQEGLQQVNQVIERSFQAIAKMKEKGIPESLFLDVKQMATIKYQYQTRENEFYALMKHASAINDEPMQTYPEHTKIIQKYEPKLIKELLAALQPEKAMIMITAVNQKTDRTEPWLGVNYRLEPVPQELLQKWKSVRSHPEMELPQPNPFLPETLAIVTNNLQEQEGILPQPDHIFEDEQGKLFLFQDHLFEMPKVSWHFYLKTPQIQVGDSASIVLGDLYVKFVKEQLNQLVYPASVADLKFKVERKDNGVAFTINGYHDKAAFLLQEILKVLRKPDLRIEKFDILKDSLQRKYQNFAKESSLKLSAELFRSVLYKQYTTEKEKASALRKVTFKKLEQFSENIWQSSYLEGTMFGNQTIETGAEVFALFQNAFKGIPYSPEEQIKKEVIILPEDQGPFYIEAKSESQGNTALLAIESPGFSFKKRAAQQILMQGIEQPFFATLRTKQQTGYIVFSYADEVEKMILLLFAVQSNSHDPRDLLSRYELFLEDFSRDLISEEQFENIRESIISQLERPVKNVQEMGELLQELAVEYQGDFNWIQKRLEGVKDLTYDEFTEISRQIIGKQNHRRLAILLRGDVTTAGINYEKTTKPKLQKQSEFIQFD